MITRLSATAFLPSLAGPEARHGGRCCRQVVSISVRRLVGAPYITERITYLADGGARAECLAERIEQVPRSLGGVPHVVDPALEFRAVAAGPQLGKPPSLPLLDGRIDAQWLVGLIAGMGDPVDPHHPALPAVNLPRAPFR